MSNRTHNRSHKSSRKSKSPQDGGTLYIKRTPTDSINKSIYQILKHATHMEVFGINSLYGLNLKITIPAEKSRLIGSSIRDLGTPKTQFLIKFVVAFDVLPRYQDHRQYYKEVYWNFNNNPPPSANGKKAVFKDDFFEEVKLQQDIFVKSSYLGNPICPAIIMGDIFKNSNGTPIDESYTKLHRELHKMAQRLHNDQFLEILHKINIAITRPRLYDTQYCEVETTRPVRDLGIGVICMELLDGYQSVYEFLFRNPVPQPRENYYTIYGKIIYELARLSNIGYFHGDLHLGNIMYNPTTQDIILIDFGRTKRIKDEALGQGTTRTHGYFRELLNMTRFANFAFSNETDKRNYLKLIGEQILRSYDYRTKENAYIRINNVNPENLFMDLTHHQIMIDMDSIQTSFANTYIERERQIRQLVQSGELNNVIHMKSLKTDVLDVYGRIKGLKFQLFNRNNIHLNNIELDIEVLMYLRQYANKVEAMTNPRVIRKLNNTKLPRYYTQRLAPIITREKRRETRRLRPRR